MSGYEKGGKGLARFRVKYGKGLGVTCEGELESK